MSARVSVWVVDDFCVDELTTFAVAITTVVMATAVLNTNKVHDARCAMGAIISGRSLPYSEDDPQFPAAVAKLAWDVAEAMAVEHARRSNAKGRGR